GRGTCIGCHTMQGVQGATARVGPNLTHLMGREKFAGDTFDINPENLNRWIHNPSKMKPMRPEQGTGMPDLVDTGPHLTDTEINQLVAFLTTLK
ncbi:MAG TPA: cytochrome c, partial [Actinomycetota bacterium]|nr:cytochrome c [Actinomycetota bacterium]